MLLAYRLISVAGFRLVLASYYKRVLGFLLGLETFIRGGECVGPAMPRGASLYYNREWLFCVFLAAALSCLKCVCLLAFALWY